MKIIQPFYHRGALLRVGNESELQNATPEELARYQDKGFIEGAPAAGEVPPTGDRRKTGDEVETLASEVSGTLGIARSSEESPEDFLRRVARECSDHKDAAERLRAVQEKVFDDRANAERQRDEAREAALQAKAALDAAIAERDALVGAQAKPVTFASYLETIVGDRAEKLLAAGLDSPTKLAGAPTESLRAIEGVGQATIDKVRATFGAFAE